MMNMIDGGTRQLATRPDLQNEIRRAIVDGTVTNIEVLTGAGKLDDARMLIRAHNVVASALMWQGRCRLAQDHFAEAVAIAERSNDRMALAVCCENLGASYYYGGSGNQAGTSS